MVIGIMQLLNCVLRWPICVSPLKAMHQPGWFWMPSRHWQGSFWCCKTCKREEHIPILCPQDVEKRWHSQSKTRELENEFYPSQFVKILKLLILATTWNIYPFSIIFGEYFILKLNFYWNYAVYWFNFPILEQIKDLVL